VSPTYSWALNKRNLLGADHNCVQLTLLKSAFLGDTSYNLSQATNPNDTGNLQEERAKSEGSANDQNSSRAPCLAFDVRFPHAHCPATDQKPQTSRIDA
jgi:hypothetical protein